MVHADRVGEKIHIITEYHQRHMTALIPGASYKKDLGVWQAPLTWPTCLIMRGVFGDLLEIGDELQAWAWKERNSRIVPANSIRAALSSNNDLPNLDEVERNHILTVLEQCRWKVKGKGNAAERLGLNPSTLSFRMKKLGIERAA